MYFAEHFAATKLAQQEIKIPSELEMHRIERSLYVFDLYKILFRRTKQSRKGRFTSKDQWTTLFSKFAPWETEQLGCIYDYLFDMITPGKIHIIEFPILHVPNLLSAFNDVAEHDVAWGDLSVPWVDDYSFDYYGYKDYILSCGLKFIRKVIETTEYKQRYKLLDKNGRGCWDDFLIDGLRTQSFDDPLQIDIIGLSNEQVETYITKPWFIDDKDPGP